MGEFKEYSGGIRAEFVFNDGEVWAELSGVRHPFRKEDGVLRFSLSENILKDFQRRGVNKFVVRHGEKSRIYTLPKFEDLVRAGEYEHRNSMFDGNPGFNLFYFKLQ